MSRVVGAVNFLWRVVQIVTKTIVKFCFITWKMNLKTKKSYTRVCIGLFFLLGGIEYGKKRINLDLTCLENFPNTLGNACFAVV